MLRQDGVDIFGRRTDTLFGCELIVVENCPEDTLVFAEVGPREIRAGCLVQTFKPLLTVTGIEQVPAEKNGL